MEPDEMIFAAVRHWFMRQEQAEMTVRAGGYCWRINKNGGALDAYFDRTEAAEDCTIEFKIGGTDAD